MRRIITMDNKLYGWYVNGGRLSTVCYPRLFRSIYKDEDSRKEIEANAGSRIEILDGKRRMTSDWRKVSKSNLVTLFQVDMETSSTLRAKNLIWISSLTRWDQESNLKHSWKPDLLVLKAAISCRIVDIDFPRLGDLHAEDSLEAASSRISTRQG